MLPGVRGVFRWLAAILFVVVVVQVGLAGYGAFDAIHSANNTSVSKKTIENGFNAHAALGSLIVLLMLIMLLVAAIGRLGPMPIRRSAEIFGLGILQMVLGIVSTEAPALGFLHTVNALAITGATGMLAHRTWTVQRVSAATPAPVT
jgi:hypothetical protein